MSCPSAIFALHHGGFVPREWLAPKDLLLSGSAVIFEGFFYRSKWGKDVRAVLNGSINETTLKVNCNVLMLVIVWKEGSGDKPVSQTQVKTLKPSINLAA